MARSAAACRPMTPRRRQGSWASPRPTSRSFSASGAAPRWSIATTWCWDGSKARGRGDGAPNVIHNHTMTAPLKTIEGSGELDALMRDIGQRARQAARVLALAPAAQKGQALAAMAAAIRARCDDILAANAEDVADARAQSPTSAF